MLDDVERGVDRSDAKLGAAMQTMRKFIRQTEGMRTAMLQVMTETEGYLFLQKRSQDGAL